MAAPNGNRFTRILEVARKYAFVIIIVGVLAHIANTAFLSERREFTAAIFFIFPIIILLGAIGMVRRAWLLLKSSHKLKVGTLILADVLGAAGIVLFCATLYMFTDITGTGALSYGHCGTSLAETLQHPVVQTPGDTVYFSAITFFTVGYGEICPMGLAKSVAVLNALAGQLFTAVILGIGVSFFIESYRQQRS